MSRSDFEPDEPRHPVPYPLQKPGPRQPDFDSGRVNFAPLFAIGRRRPWTVVGLAILVLALAGAVAGRLRIETDVLALIPSQNRIVTDFRQTLERFGSLDLVLVAIELPAAVREEGASLDPYLAFADELATELRAVDGVAWLEYHSEEAQAAVVELVPWAPLFLAEDDLAGLLATASSAEGLGRSAAELAQALRSPMDLPRKQLRLLDPLGMVPKALASFDLEALEGRFDGATGYLVDPGQHFVLLVVKPERPAADVPFGRRLVAEVASAAERAEASWRQAGWADDGADLGEDPGDGGFEITAPQVLVGGGHAVATADADRIVRDLGVGTAFALVAVGLLFMAAFGRLAALPVAFAPLLVGLAATFAFAFLALGRLNAVTAAFAALLIGLGIDFVIVLYGRYAEERAAGCAHGEALEICGRHAAPGVALGAVTTGVTFLAFLVSEFEGLWELGVLTTAGILLVLLSVCLLLPAILTLLDRRSASVAGESPAEPGERGRALRAFGSERLFLWSHRHPRTVLWVNGLLTLGLAWAAFHVPYDDDALSLRSANNPGLVTQNRIMDAFGLRFTPYMVRVDGADEEQAMERARELLAELEPLEDGERLARVESALPWLPPFENQRARIQQLRAANLDPEAVRAGLVSALEAEGLRAAAFEEGLRNLETALALDAPKGPSALAETSLGHALGRYVAASEDGFSTVIYCYPPPGAWRRQAPPDLEQAVAAREWAVLTGPVIVSAELKKVVWKDATWAGIIGTIGVFLFLVWDLGGLRGGGVRKAGLALLPLGLGLVWMLGWMAVSGMAVNFMNLFVFTMILGIGVDYGIHLLHRLEEGDRAGDSGADDPGAEDPGVLATAGLAPAITVAACTTVAGFGSLVLSDFPGLQSMGAAAIFGVLSVAWLGLTLLPALRGLRRRSAPASAAEDP